MYCGDQYRVTNLESDRRELMNCSSRSLTGFGEKWGNAEKSKASGKSRKKTDCASDTKAVAALKSHSEAERRRRERINAHLESLRRLVPNSEKMDKATLLAEVISQVKQLQTTAARACDGLHIPMDTDSVEIAVLEDEIHGSFLMKASLCCNYMPDLSSNIKLGIESLPVQVLRSEMSTFGGRVKSVFLIATRDGNNAVPRECIVGDVRRVLGDVLDKVSTSLEYNQLVFPRTRQRVSHFDSP